MYYTLSYKQTSLIQSKAIAGFPGVIPATVYFQFLPYL
jgi:hypothetical protein